MAEIFTEGFDKYGPAGILGIAGGTGMTLAQLLAEGDWTSVSLGAGGAVAIVAGLNGVSGQALQITVSSSNANYASKTLGSNFTRLIGGFRFASNLGGSRTAASFLDATTAQCSIVVNPTGTISLHTGTLSGATLAISSSSVSANSAHYLEWDITFGASSSYQLWLDGVSLFSGTGATKTSSNSYANAFTLGDAVAVAGAVNYTFDDLYLFDSTGSTNNAVLLTNPVVATTFGTSDSSVAFSVGVGVLGKAYYTTASTNAPGVDVFLVPVTPAINCTLNNVSCVPRATSAGANFKSVLYSDSGGSPNSLVATGTQATGTTSGTTLTSAFSGGQALTGGTQYWIGFITDTSVVLQEADTSTTGQKKANTYASGAPATLTGQTTGQPTWLIFGGISGMATNYTEDNLSPPLGTLSYVDSAAASTTDLYGFGALPGTPGTIYTTCVKANVAIATAGSRTVSLQLRSGSTTSAGSNSGQTPLVTQSWLDSFFTTDPNTGLAWTISGLNAATSGLTIAS